MSRRLFRYSLPLVRPPVAAGGRPAPGSAAPASLVTCTADRQVYLSSSADHRAGIRTGGNGGHGNIPDLSITSVGRTVEGRNPALARRRGCTNLTSPAGCWRRWEQELGCEVGPEDLFAYCYALLASPAYVGRFSEELTIPGPRVPLTKDPALFRQGAALGTVLIRLHTYGERFAKAGHPAALQGSARCTRPVGETVADYP